MNRADPGAAPKPERAIPPARAGDWVGIVLGAALLLWPAALNGYPLIYSDTGNYLGQALQHYIGWNAPPFYSFFLLATDWRLSLWPPIVVQSLIAAHLLSVVLRQFGWGGAWPVLVTSVALSLVSTLPWFVSFLTPYVFAAFVVLAVWLLAFGTVGVWERRYLLLLAIGSVAVHFSHVPLAAGLAVIGGVTAAAYGGLRAGVRAFARMIVAPVVVALMLIAVNLVAHGKASMAPYGSVLLAARMLYDGTATNYLHAACPARAFKICPFVDRLPSDRDDFLFNWPPMTEALGGAEAWAPEAREIVSGTLAHDPMAVVRAGLGNTLTLFGHLWLGGALQAWPDNPGPAPLIGRYFPPGESAAFVASEQTRGHLMDDAAREAPVEVALTWVGIAALLVLLVVERRRPLGWTLCILVLAALLGNALITGALSGIEDHYEARLAWLPVFVAGVIGARRLAAARGTAAPS